MSRSRGLSTHLLLLGLSVALLFGCSSLAAHRSNLVTVTWDSDGEDAPRVGTITVWGERLPRPETIWLVEGRVPRATALELAQGKTPEGLQESRVPLLVTGQPESLALWARVRLKASEVYSIIALGAGVVATFQTTAEEVPQLARLGPPQVHQGDWVPYCLAPGHAFSGASSAKDVEWATGGVVQYRLGMGRAGIARERCVEFQVTATAALLLPPIRFLGADVDPEIVMVEPQTATQEKRLSGAVGATSSGVIEVSQAASFAALRVRDELGGTREVVAEYGRARLSGVQADATYTVDYVIQDELGRHEGSEELSLGAGAPHFVISEVFADPEGAEPEGEWVELMNVGNAAGSLSGYILASDRSEWTLPDVTMEPGAYGLIVRDDFFVDAELDRVPESAAVRIPVGKLALKNSGVALSLLNPRRDPIADFPALVGKPGVSVARLDPLADGASALGLHEEPGSSPGAANLLRIE